MTNDELAELLEGIAVNTEDYYRQDVLRTARDRLRNIPNCEDCQITAELRELLIGCSPVTGTFKTPEELASHLRSLK